MREAKQRKIVSGKAEQYIKNGIDKKQNEKSESKLIEELTSAIRKEEFEGMQEDKNNGWIIIDTEKKGPDLVQKLNKVYEQYCQNEREKLEDTKKRIKMIVIAVMTIGMKKLGKKTRNEIEKK